MDTSMDMDIDTVAGKHSLEITPSTNNNEATPLPKRLRGGGGDEWEEELYDDDEIEEYMDEPDDCNPSNANANTHSSSTGDTSDTALSLEGLTTSQLKRWARNPIPESLSNTRSRSCASEDIHLQWLDIDMLSGQPLAQNPNASKKHVIGGTQGEVPIIRVYGVTDLGNSIVTFIHGYTPYGYFALPEGHHLGYGSESQKGAMLAKIRDVLNARMKNAKSHNRKIETDIIQGVQYIEDHKSIMGYSTAHTRFLKIYVSLPHYVPTLKRVLEEGVSLPGITAINGARQQNVWDDAQGTNYQPFECNVPFVLRFMIDRSICGAGWLTLSKGTYAMRKDKITNCQVSFFASYWIEVKRNEWR
jgi:hypothetical protein